jgi:hypothetical protein
VTRSFSRSVCRALIGVVLLAQMAVSAYACPGLSSGAKMGGPMSSVSSMDVADKALTKVADQQAADCAGMAGPMDPEFANLCAEHCHHGQQSDQAATLTVPAALLTALYITPLAPEPYVAPRPAAAAKSALAAASPPLAILHCCFRI